MPMIESQPRSRKSTPNFSQSFAGWHTLLLQVSGGQIKYYIDGTLMATHGGIYYPETPMSINFNLWFITLQGGSTMRQYRARRAARYLSRPHGILHWLIPNALPPAFSEVAFESSLRPSFLKRDPHARHAYVKRTGGSRSKPAPWHPSLAYPERSPARLVIGCMGAPSPALVFEKRSPCPARPVRTAGVFSNLRVLRLIPAGK